MVNATQITPHEAEVIAFEGCVAAYPLVLLDEARQLHAAAPNHFAHVPPGADIGLGHANPHVLYSSAWLDLTAGPVVLSLPDLHGHHCAIAMIDAWGEVIGSLGVRAAGEGAGDVAVVGPGWVGDLAQEMRTVRASTNAVWLLGRTLLEDDSDQTRLALQGRIYLTPLGEVMTRAPSIKAWRDWPADRCVSMPAEAFFDRVAQLLALHARPRVNSDWIDRLQQIGVTAGQPYRTAALPPLVAEAIRNGVEAAQARIARSAWGRPVTGAQPWTAFGRRPRDYDPLGRAASAHSGLGFHMREDAFYFSARLDEDGAMLNGVERYRLHFAPRQTPPVAAFWSLVVYDLDRRAVVCGAARKGITNRDPLRFNIDGSLDIRLQRQHPAPPLAANWLALPDGPFEVVLRAYAPGSGILKGSWRPPALRRMSSPATRAEGRSDPVRRWRGRKVDGEDGPAPYAPSSPAARGS